MIEERYISYASRPPAETMPSRLSAWLVVALTGVLLVWPISQFAAQLKTYLAINQRSASNAQEPLVTLATSRHFRVDSPNGYMSRDEAQQFVAEAEMRRPLLLAFLQQPDNERRIIVRMYPGKGASQYLGGDVIELVGFKEGKNAFIHELTHLFMPRSTGLFDEGLAVLAAERFPWGWGFSSFYPGEVVLYASLRNEPLIPAMVPLHAIGAHPLYDSSAPVDSAIRYQEAGSFVKYLIATYGFDTFMRVYHTGYPGFEEIYHRPVAAIEREWMRALTIGHVRQALCFVLAGLAVLVLTQGAHAESWPWRATPFCGLLAFMVWSYCYMYFSPWLYGGMTLAVLAGRLSPNTPQPWRRIAMWLVGLGTLLACILVPAL